MIQKNYITLSKDQMFVLSLIPHNNESHDITLNEISFLNNSEIIYDNREEYLKSIEDIYKNKLKECKLCNKKYDKLNDLKKHVIVNCFFNEIKNRKKKDQPIHREFEKNIEINIINNGIINNNNTINNTTNNITLNINTPISFDEKWDVSKIDSNTKLRIIVGKMVYSKLLEEILKNNKNLNVIIDKDANAGLVFKNTIETYIEMKLSDIIDETVAKLNEHLLDFNEEAKISESIIEEYYIHNRRRFNKDYIDYTKNIGKNDEIMDIISSIYEQKNNISIDILKNIVKKSI